MVGCGPLVRLGEVGSSLETQSNLVLMTTLLTVVCKLYLHALLTTVLIPGPQRVYCFPELLSVQKCKEVNMFFHVPVLDS